MKGCPSEARRKIYFCKTAQEKVSQEVVYALLTRKPKRLEGKIPFGQTKFVAHVQMGFERYSVKVKKFFRCLKAVLLFSANIFHNYRLKDYLS